MLLTMILGAAAGYAAPKAEPFVQQGLDKVEVLKDAIGETGITIFTVLVLLFFASLLCVVVGVSANGAVLSLFAAAGMFGQKIFEGVKASRAAVEDAEIVEDAEEKADDK